MNVEKLAAELVSLASKPTLTKGELGKARELMRQLKEQGMSNEEIAKLSNGKWSESTVKGYTKGIKAANSSPWQDAVALFNELVTAGMSLEDVDIAVGVAEELKSWEVSLEDVSNFLTIAESASIGPEILVHQGKELSECGLSPKDLGEALNIKKELEEKGLPLDRLPALVKLASSYGAPEKILEAVSLFGSLDEINTDIHKAQVELQNLSDKRASVEHQLEETQAKVSELEKPLQAYQKAVALGFGQEELVALSGSAEKYGGPKAVLKGIKAYTNYSEIADRVTKTKAELNSLESRVNALDAKYSHLKAAIAMCQSLIHDHQMGLDFISTMLFVGKKYGDPLDVLKAVDTYGSLKATTDELEKLKGEVQQKKGLLNKVEGQYEATLEQLESLNAMALKVGAEVAKVESRLQESVGLHKVMNLIHEPGSVSYSEYGPLVVAIAASLQKWVAINEQKFKFPQSIKSGLETLIKELGGD
jgi:prefoldin subunit 5